MFWNYNKHPEDTSRGVKSIVIFLDGKSATEGWSIPLRKAPGHAEFDFAQFVPLPCPEPIPVPSKSVFASERIPQDYETPCLPQGFILKLRLFGTWGDMHYIGLNGIEVYEETGGLVNAENCQIYAAPCSVKDLPGMSSDVRTPEKLLDGVNATQDDRHMWLAPFVSAFSCNELLVVFNRVVNIAYLKLWNYSKTPQRGVKELEISLDDAILFTGVLRRGGAAETPSVVLFTGDRKTVEGNAQGVYRNAQKPSVLLFNENRLVGGQEHRQKLQERPHTGVVLS